MTSWEATSAHENPLTNVHTFGSIVRALPDRLNPNLASVVAGVKKAGIAPVKFAGGHGSTADYAPLAALEGK